MRRIFSIAILLLLSFQFYGQDVEITPKTKKAIQRKLVKHIKENYAFPGEVENIKEMLSKLVKSDEYKNANTTSLFGRLVTGALREFTNDPHFNVLYNPQMFGPLEAINNGDEGEAEGISLSAMTGGSPDLKRNFNFQKLEVLPGNIGYMRITQIPNINQAKPTLDAAMAFLQHTDAFILDLRSNPGGVGGFISYLGSYFFPEEKKLLFTREFPAYDSTTYFYTEPELPGKRLEEQPLYVLIDRFTGSAATNFSYFMQKHGRALIVGEITGEGREGGHSAGGFALAEGFIATVPIAKVVHPVTGTDFGMTGVVPDYPTDPEEALTEANKLILQSLIEKESDGASKDIMQEALKELMQSPEKEVEKEEVDVSQLEAFVGEYEGNRNVLVENGKLLYLRMGQSKLEMAKVDKDTYKLVLPSNVRSAGTLPLIRFDRGSDGSVTQISFVMEEDGNVVSTAKKSN